MTTTEKELLASSTGITITLANLANSSLRQSTAIDNTSNLYLDVLVNLTVKTNGSAPSGQKSVFVWVYASEDGTNYSGEASGSDGSYTITVPTNLALAAVISCPSANTAYTKVFSVAAALGGFGCMPRKWGIVVYNLTGNALSNTEGDHIKSYTGIHRQGV